VDFSFALFQYNISRPKPVLQNAEVITFAPDHLTISSSESSFTTSINPKEVSVEALTTSTVPLQTEAQFKAIEKTEPTVDTDLKEESSNDIEDIAREPSDPDDLAVKAMEEMKTKLLPSNPEDDEILAFAAKNWAKRVLNSRGNEILFKEGGLKLSEVSNWNYEALHTDSSPLWKLMTERAENARTVCKEYNQLLEKYTSTKTILNYIPRIDQKKCKGLGLCSILKIFDSEQKLIKP